MKMTKKGCLIPIAIAGLLITVLYVSIWMDDSERRRNREHVNELIKVGENLNEAQSLLRREGYRFIHDKPIKPTVNEDYFQHIVIIGNTYPNVFESFGYATGLSWMPFIHNESPYVIIDASLDGTITRIE